MLRPDNTAMRTVGLLVVLLAASGSAPGAKPSRQMPVHVVQASGQSNYALVRANWHPGEIDHPWAVRFFDGRGKEVPYFVWDWLDWKTAQEGRPDWGGQYPLLQHYPGNDPTAKSARADKLAWAKKFLPAEAADLERLAQAARQSPRSPCVVLYLLRFRASPHAKDRLTVKLFAEQQVRPLAQEFTGTVKDVAVGDLELKGFPLRAEVTWKGKSLFRHAGFNAGETASKHNHARADRGYSWSLQRGIISKLRLRGKTEGRRGGDMSWDCTYWLFPEGACVALEGFSLDRPEGYVGGPQQMSILQASEPVTSVASPTWSRPWYVQQVGTAGFAALHLFSNAPLTVGYDNNPFIVGAERRFPGQLPQIEVSDSRLALTWDFNQTDLGVLRLFAPHLVRALPEKNQGGGKMVVAPKFLADAMRTGKLPPIPKGMYARDRAHLEEQLKLVRWQPKVDFLYRQYAVGVGQSREAAEQAVAHPVCVAGGWLDRPWDEERLARLIVDVVREWGQVAVAEDNCTLHTWPVHLLVGEVTGQPTLVRAALKHAHPERLVRGREIIERVKAAGDDPRVMKKNDGVFGNPGYHSSETPRVELLLDYFGHDQTRPEFRKGLVEWADYLMPILGGQPFDWERYRQAYLIYWPSRTVLILPTLLYAHRVTKKAFYREAVVKMFDDLYALQDANPLGYWSCWSFRPTRGGRDYDTVYLGATTERGLWAFYTQKQVQLVGPGKLSRLVAGLCRATLVGHHLASNGETDNFTSEATSHGGHPQTRLQGFLLLQDDFDFYKGLVGDMVRWGVLAPERTDGLAFRWLTQNRMFIGHGAGSPIVIPLMWALGVQAGEHPQQSRLQMLEGGWRGAIRNALPGGRAPLSVTLGDRKPQLRKTNRPLSQRALWRVTVLEPTYRTWARVEVESSDRQETIRTSHRTLVFFAYPAAHSGWNDERRLQVVREQGAGKETPVAFTVRDGGLVFTADRGAVYRVCYR